MKTQVHNEGELAALTVNIEKKIVESVAIMSENSKLSEDDLVCIALKRFIASHADYMNNVPDPL